MLVKVLIIIIYKVFIVPFSWKYNKKEVVCNFGYDPKWNLLILDVSLFITIQHLGLLNLGFVIIIYANILKVF